MRSKINPQELALILQDEGLKAKLETDAEGDPCIKSASNGWNWQIYFDDRNENGTRLAFTLGLGLSSDIDVDALCNKYNRERLVGSMWHSERLDSDGEWFTALQFHVSLIGGVSEDWLKHQLARWDAAITAFSDEVREIG